MRLVCSLFVEARLIDAEDIGATGGTEAIFSNFEDTFAVGFAIFLFVDVEFASDVDGVEDCIFAGEVARFSNLADEGDDGVVGFCPVGKKFD